MFRAACSYLLVVGVAASLSGCGGAGIQAQPNSYSLNVAAFSPASGPTGTTVAISGTGFQQVRTVSFNGSPSSYQVISDTAITALVPTGASSGPVSVQTNWGSASSPVSFNVTTTKTSDPTAPTISSFSPTSGSVGTSVTISGSGFSGATRVAFNGVNATFAVSSASQISTSVPTGATTGAISVTTPNGTATSSGTFNVSTSTTLKNSGPINLNAQSNVTISGLHITSTTGDCVTITNSANITIQQSEIGPCAGNGIKISGGTSVNVYDSYIHAESMHACCDKGDGIYATGVSYLTVQGNVIAYNETNIEISNATDPKIIGNFLLNPRNTTTGSRGENVQAWGGNSNITVENNYALSSEDTTLYTYAAKQEDSINFGKSSGILVENNYIEGGLSPSGCGIIADNDANSATFSGNTLVNTGSCGIGIASGTNQVINSNRIITLDPVSGGGNRPLYVWNQYSVPCGPVSISNNIGAVVLSNGTINSYWLGGGCGTISFSNNTWGQAAVTALTPPPSPPLIPPEPHACPAPSPYTTQHGCGR